MSSDEEGALMEEERLNELIRQTLAESRQTPEPPLDEMWAQIERRAFGDAASSRIPFSRQSRWVSPMLAAAAALVIGVGLGWYAAPRGTLAPGAASPTATASLGGAVTEHTTFIPAHTPDGANVNSPQDVASSSDYNVPAAHGTPGTTEPRLASQFDDMGNGTEMGRYLGQTAALLASLPSDHSAAESDTALATRASDLLTQTHLLLDSHAGSDPTLHRLLEDLELVLAQVARLRGPRNGADLQLIHQALTVHDVLPRVHDATLEASITD